MARNLGANSGYRRYTFNVIESVMNDAPYTALGNGPEEMLDHEVTNLMTAPTYWLQKDMQKVVRLGASSLPHDVRLTPRATITPQGFVVFEDLEVIKDIRNDSMAALAVSWCPTQLGVPFPAANVLSLGGDPSKDQVLENLKIGFSGLGEPAMQGSGEPTNVFWSRENEVVYVQGISLCIWSWPWDPLDSHYESFKGLPLQGEPLLLHHNFWPFGYVVPGTSSNPNNPLNDVREQTHGYRFLYAFWQIAQSRIAARGRLNRSEERKMTRVHPERELRIVVLRRRESGGGTQTDPEKDGYKIDYQYAVAPHWQRYHTKEGVVWLPRDWYTAGPDGAPLLERDTIYSVQQ